MTKHYTNEPTTRPRSLRDAINAGAPSLGTDHVFEVERALIRNSRGSTSNLVLELGLRILGGPDDGKRIEHGITLNQVGGRQVRMLLEATGLDDDALDRDESVLVGRTFEAHLERNDAGYFQLTDLHAATEEA